MRQVGQRTHERRRGAPTAAAPGLLCVANFPANTGYAWDFIEGLYAGVSERLRPAGVQTFVAYPSVPAPPRSLAGTQATAVELDAGLADRASLQATMEFVRRHNIEVMYLCDRPVWNPRYAALRRAGVRTIIVHDHTSGDRTEPRGLKRALKRARMLLPGSVADQVIAVSDFVARRKLRVDLLPARRVKRVWNSVDVLTPPAARARLHQAFGLAEDRPVIVCASRAAPEKGLQLLLRAFDRLVREGPIQGGRPMLIYMGDGPELAALRELRDALPARDDILLTGYVERASELIAGAELCVVPSVWQEAFGLAALEPMASGVAVIASRVGGIAEIIVDGETGRLVPPGDEGALSQVMRELLSDPAERARLGAQGRRRALETFSREKQLDQLHTIVAAGFNGTLANGEPAHGSRR